MTGPPLHPRRTVLAAGLVACLVACTGRAPGPGPIVGRTARADPDAALLAAAAARERALIAAYDAALLADPGLEPLLGPLREHHREHLVALRADPLPAAGSGSATPTAGIDKPLSAPTKPDLAQAERDAGAAHARDVVHASRALAGVLATLAAAEASHPVALA